MAIGSPLRPLAAGALPEFQSGRVGYGITSSGGFLVDCGIGAGKYPGCSLGRDRTPFLWLAPEGIRGS